MTIFEKWYLTITAAGVIATLIVAVIAIWGEKIRQLWTKPKLLLTLDEPTLTKTNDGRRGWYYILRVSNKKSLCPAINARVHLTKVLKKAPDGTWIDQRFSGPTQVLWRWPDKMPLYVTVGPVNYATFACLHEPSDKIELRLLFYPNNLNPYIKPNDPTRLVFEVVSDTVSSDEVTIEIAWDGSWVEGRLEMNEHLIVKEIKT